MQQVEYRKEGMQNYISIVCDPTCILCYESNLMQYHKVPYFLPYEVRTVDGYCELYYRLQYRTSLKSVLGHLKLTRKRLYHMVKSIVGAFIAAEEYLFSPELIVWNTEYIFLEADTGNLQFCFFPDENEEHGNVTEVLVQLMQFVDRSDKQATMFLLQFYDLITEPDCTLEKLRVYLEKGSGQQQEKRCDSKMYLDEDDVMQNQCKGNVWRDEEISVRRNKRREMEVQDNLKAKSKQHNEREKGLSDKRKQSIKEKQKNKNSAERFEMQKQQKQQSESFGQRILLVLLILVALVNVTLIVLLLINVLPYESMQYLFGSMIAMIVLTILYMSFDKEETPDEIMKRYFEEEENTITEFEQNSMEFSEVLKGEGFAYKPQEEVFGETTLLCADYDYAKYQIVEERYEMPLILVPHNGQKYEPIYIENSIVVGCMQEGCDYLLCERGISRMHAKIMKKDDGLYLLDLNSTNGTFLNGEELVRGEEYPLKDGDVVVFAKCEFHVVHEKIA